MNLQPAFDNQAFIKAIDLLSTVPAAVFSSVAIAKLKHYPVCMARAVWRARSGGRWLGGVSGNR